jgi:hypothetical protein
MLKTEKNKIKLFKRAQNLLAGMKALLGEGGRKHRRGAVMLRPIRIQYDGVWISARLPSTHIYISYIVDHVYIKFRLAQNSICAGPFGTKLCLYTLSAEYRSE